jgi:hypothetical protein
MSEPVQIFDYVAQGLSLFTSQFTADKAPQLRAWTASYLAQAQALENAIWDVIRLRRLANAVLYSPPPGTFAVSHGSTLVVCSQDQTSKIFAGNMITFASQPGVSYVVQSVTAAVISIAAVYTGTSAPATSADTTQYNPVLDANGALVGQQRLGLDDAGYLSAIYLRIAVDNSDGSVASWSGFASILLRTSGGPAFYFESGTGGTGKSAGFYFGIWDMSLNPNVVALILNDAVPDGEGPDCFAWSVWPDGNDFAVGSVYATSSVDTFTDILGIALARPGNLVPGLLGAGYGTSESGWSSVYDANIGGLMVAATALS